MNIHSYRVVEETGRITNEKRFYIEYASKNIFGKLKWKRKYIKNNGAYKLVEFDNLLDAKNWLYYETEFVNKKFHYPYEW
jgi:hypothetical protein